MSLTPLTRWNPDDYRIARRKMVETQIKRRGITDHLLLQAMIQIPRHFFVDQAQAAQTYLDSPLPIGYGQTISQPFIVARMVEALKLTDHDRVLEIGSGSGYQTAILATLAGEVFAVERIEPLFCKGRENLSRLAGLSNIRLKLDDGTLGWPEQGPYQAIIVAAGGPKIPQPLVDQLSPGGRLIVPVGTDKHQQLVLISKDSQGQATRQDLGACRFVALVGRHGWDS